MWKLLSRQRWSTISISILTTNHYLNPFWPDMKSHTNITGKNTRRTRLWIFKSHLYSKSFYISWGHIISHEVTYWILDINQSFKLTHSINNSITLTHSLALNHTQWHSPTLIIPDPTKDCHIDKLCMTEICVLEVLFFSCRISLVKTYIYTVRYIWIMITLVSELLLWLNALSEWYRLESGGFNPPVSIECVRIESYC